LTNNCNFIDEHGLKLERHLNVHDVWSLSAGQRVVVQFNEFSQPIGDGGGLLGVFLGTVIADFTLFPISYRMWSTIPKAYKNDVFKNTIQVEANNLYINFMAIYIYIYISLFMLIFCFEG